MQFNSITNGGVLYMKKKKKETIKQFLRLLKWQVSCIIDMLFWIIIEEKKQANLEKLFAQK